MWITLTYKTRIICIKEKRKLESAAASGLAASQVAIMISCLEYQQIGSNDTFILSNLGKVYIILHFRSLSIATQALRHLTRTSSRYILSVGRKRWNFCDNGICYGCPESTETLNWAVLVQHKPVFVQRKLIDEEVILQDRTC
jgi:hypothetical protein